MVAAICTEDGSRIAPKGDRSRVAADDHREREGALAGVRSIGDLLGDLLARYQLQPNPIPAVNARREFAANRHAVPAPSKRSA
ncbi:MAG TPA: hypothetical protein VFE24_10045 [Pirellulales bacterium]|jgi:hypothetical protein|nr:hypothetical protein [Pirellulales bacterium]